MTNRDWTPVLRGPIYCSPACGCRCTHAAFEQAQRNADALVLQMGAGWEPVVWENGGWNWRAQKGVCAIYPSISREDDVRVVVGYTAFLNTTARQFLGKSNDSPVDAFRDALSKAHCAMSHALTELELLSPGIRALALEWQPIETAPEDGTEVLVRIRPKVICLGWYFKRSSRTEGWCDQSGKPIKPIEWAHLPKDRAEPGTPA